MLHIAHVFWINQRFIFIISILFLFVFRNRAAMFVANHNSWMDIPFMGYTMGWRNYKLISKAELGKVPILGKSIKEGGHVMVDRSNRKSQLQTFKAGVQWLLVRSTNVLVIHDIC
jgi:1-acyl-sn-glycerol-3-phosphate acyltransferase